MHLERVGGRFVAAAVLLAVAGNAALPKSTRHTAARWLML